MDKVVKNASPNWGGKRPGAGRVPTNRKQRSIWLTDKEYEQLKPHIQRIKMSEIRIGGQDPLERLGWTKEDYDNWTYEDKTIRINNGIFGSMFTGSGNAHLLGIEELNAILEIIESNK